MSDPTNSEIQAPQPPIETPKESPSAENPLDPKETELVDSLEHASNYEEALHKLANESNSEQKSITGKELPIGWPQILTPEDELDGYDVLYDEGDDRSQPPKNPHIERLSFELQQQDKKLRFFAVSHQRDMSGPDDPNMKQYEVLEENFRESPPELVLYEGVMDGMENQLTREQAIALGEPAFMLYLAQQHNMRLKEGEKPIVIDSGDKPVNQKPNEIRDPYIIRNIAEKFSSYDKIDIVFGSGHAIRDKVALEQLFT